MCIINCFAFIISMNDDYMIHCDHKYKNNQCTNTFDIASAFIITMNDLMIVFCDYKCETVRGSIMIKVRGSTIRYSRRHGTISCLS